MYGHLSTGLGISPNEVEEMYLDRAEDLLKFWREFPPPHVLVRGAVGYKPPSEDAPRDTSPPPIGAL